MNMIVRRNGRERGLTPFYRRHGLFEDIDRLAQELWGSWKPFAPDYFHAPRTDIYEENDQLVMKTELPGIDKDDLEIILEGDRLSISAEKKTEGNEDAEYHLREQYYGQYSRSVKLPYPVKENKITATFENGVLELRLPRAAEAKPKKIKVNARLSGGAPVKKRGKAKKTTNR